MFTRPIDRPVTAQPGRREIGAGRVTGGAIDRLASLARDQTIRRTARPIALRTGLPRFVA
jgi:hypothetical protein